MRNRKYFPFERNSYYYGKLLTAKNFEMEQTYLNDKRRLINRLTGGNGILSGLGVVQTDDASLAVQAGCALDAGGREIVVPQTRVVKLSTIEGFSQLTSACAYLGISYDEQPAEEAVPAMGEPGQEPCYDTVREGYKLTLLDESLAARVPLPEEAFVGRLVVYSDQDVELTQYTPKFVPLGGDVCVRVKIRRTGAGTGAFSFCYDLEAPGFCCGEHQNTIPIVVNSLVLSPGEERSFRYRLTPQQHIWGGNSSVTATVANFTIQKNDQSFRLNENLEVLLRPVRESLDGFVLSDWYGRAMDQELEETYDQRLWLARIRLLRQGASVLIDRVEPPPFGQYCYNAQQLMLLRRLADYYPSGGAAPENPAAAAQPGLVQPAARADADLGRYTACGSFDMPLGLGYDPKQSIFSEEIMHGLGRGPVCVQVGVEYLTGGPKGSEASEILVGDLSVFGQDARQGREERIYQLSTCVKVLPERGTFVVGVRPGEASGLISLRIRWYAFRLNELSKQLRQGREGERYILVNPDTIVLPPKGTAHISPVFINMPAEACTYRVVDAEGGSIDNNGVYTAPAKEGVYEIRVEAISDPTVYVHAFAIVTQKKKD